MFQHDNAYKFLHDRIQQAAYSLIPEEHRANIHLHIGRVLLASMTADQLAEHLFDVANQFNQGAALLIDRDEKAQAATIALRAGRKAKASSAYASARAYVSAGMALLDERDWGSQYELTFALRLERAECEFLTGNVEKAEQLIGELLQRRASKVDQAAVYHLKILLHILKAENSQAVNSALECLRLFGIDLPAHPTFEQVQAEYETIWQTLNGALDREPDRSADNDRSRTTGRDAGALGHYPRLPHYRQSLRLLARVSHGERQRAARDERRFRERLCPSRVIPRTNLPTLQRGLSFRQARM